MNKTSRHAHTKILLIVSSSKKKKKKDRKKEPKETDINSIELCI